LASPSFEIAQRCARDAATFIQPQLALVKHDHRGEKAKLIWPVIEITVHPASKKRKLYSPRVIFSALRRSQPAA
jgi:hypothetical protein